MRSIRKKDLGEKLILLLNEDNPLDEDIQILDETGSVTAAIITDKAYQFFLAKVEEEEDELDNKTVESFHH